MDSSLLKQGLVVVDLPGKLHLSAYLFGTD